MAVEICPGCRQRYSRATHNTDTIHQCTTDDNTWDEEDVKLLGAWEDFSGSGTAPITHVGWAGTINELQGTEAGIEKARFPGVTDRGLLAPFYRQRPRLKFLDLRGQSPFTK